MKPAHGKHAAQEGVTGIVAVVALIKHTTWLIGKGHTVIHTHRQSATRIALTLVLRLLEDAAKLNQMATSTQVRSFSEVTIREDVAGTKVNEVGAVGKLLCHCHTVVVLTGREGTCTDGQTVVLVRHGIQHPLDILGTAADSRPAEYRIRRIIRLSAHVDVILIADRYAGRQPVFHILLQLLRVDAIVKLQPVAELLYRSRVTLAEVTRNKALGFDDDVLYQGMILLWC